MSALGKLVASVVLDTSEFTVGTDKAKYLAAQAAGSIDRSFRDLEKSVGGALGGIAAALAAGFGIHAMKEAFDSYAKGAAALEDLGLKAGTSIAFMSSISPVAKLSGTSLDEVAAAAAKLSKGIVNASKETAGATHALAFLGISATDSAGKLKDSGTLIDEIAIKLDEFENGTAKTTIAMDLFGKAGANMLPFLKDLAEYGERNASVTEQQAAAAKMYEQDLVRLTIAKDALFKVISKELLPVADAFVKALLQMQTQSGGVKDSVDALAASGAIRDFAMAGVRGFGLILDAGDSVVRIFKLVGEEVGYQLANVETVLGSIGKAIVSFIRGNYRESWAELTDAAGKGTALAAAHGEEMRAILEKPLAGQTFVAGVEKNLTAIDHALNSSTKQVKASADGYKALAPAVAAADDGLKALLASEIALLKAMEQLTNIAKDYEASLREQISQQEFDVALIGKTTDEVKLLTEMRKLDMDLAKQIGRIYALVDGDIGAAQQAEIARLLNLKDLAKARIGLILDSGVAARAAMKDIEAQAKMWDDMGTAAGNFFGDLVVNGKSAFDRLKQNLKSFAQELIALFAKRWILNMVAGGGVMGAAGDALAGGAGGNSIAGSLMSAGGSYLSSALGGSSLLSSGVALYQGAATAGTAYAGATAMAADAYGVSTAAALGEGLGTALAAIPVYGWIALAVIAVAAWFSGRGGGPKTGGYSGSSFDAAGNLTGSATAPGTDNGRYFTPNDMDAGLRTVTEGFGRTYAAAVTRLGGTARGFSFLLGADNDPQGTAQSRVSGGLLDASGRSLYSNVDQSMDDKEVPAAIALEMSRAVLVALQNSGLPAYLSQAFEGLDAMTATQADIDNAIAMADALHSIFDVVSHSPMEDIATAMADSQNQLSAAMRNNERVIHSVMDAYDGTLATTQSLASATTGYYNAQLQLIAGIQQARTAIDEMFDSTFRNIQLAGMDRQAQYNFYQQDAQSLQAQALASSDPATIQRLAGQINQDIQAAFGLLSPEEQMAQSAAFLTEGRAAQAAIDERMERITADAAATTQATLNQIRDAIGAGANAQQTAANTQVDAANAQLVAAGIPIQIVVTLPSGQQVTSI